MKLSELTYVAFDLETTGKYPLQSEICEIAAVKWCSDKMLGEFHTLLKPKQRMGEAVIAIHGITNEMVETALPIEDKLDEFYQFIDGAVVVAHHAPFDLGFMALELETHGFNLPLLPAFCTSLLARKLYPESTNHRLQTLIPFFGLNQGTAHRALDDALACCGVFLKCLVKLAEKYGPDVTVAQAEVEQGAKIAWSRFSMNEIKRSAVYSTLIDAISRHSNVEMTYLGGSSPGRARVVLPIGIVRSLDGDFLVAQAADESKSKRYFLDRVRAVVPIP